MQPLSFLVRYRPHFQMVSVSSAREKSSAKVWEYPSALHFQGVAGFPPGIFSNAWRCPYCQKAPKCSLNDDSSKICWALIVCTASQVAQTVKNLSAMRTIWIQSLGWEDPLEKGTATHSSLLVWRIPWTEESGGLQSMGLKESNTAEQLTLSPDCLYRFFQVEMESL